MNEINWKNTDNWQELEHAKYYLIVYKDIFYSTSHYGIGYYHKGQRTWYNDAWHNDDGEYTGNLYIVTHWTELPTMPKD